MKKIAFFEQLFAVNRSPKPAPHTLFRVSALGTLPRDTFRTRAPERTAPKTKIYRPKTEGGIFFPRINFYERKRNYNGRHKIFTPNAVHLTLGTKYIYSYAA